MSRPREIERRDVSIDDLYGEYISTPEMTLDALGAKYGLSRWTLARYFKSKGYSVKKRGGDRSLRPTGVIDRYVREHPEVVLSRSPKELAEIIPGCTIDAAKSWRKRRKREFIERVKALPNLRKTNVAFKGKNPWGDEVLLKMKDFTRYTISADWESETVLIQGDHREYPKQSFRFHLDQLESILNPPERT